MLERRRKSSQGKVPLDLVFIFFLLMVLMKGVTTTREQWGSFWTFLIAGQGLSSTKEWNERRSQLPCLCLYGFTLHNLPSGLQLPPSGTSWLFNLDGKMRVWEGRRRKGGIRLLLDHSQSSMHLCPNSDFKKTWTTQVITFHVLRKSNFRNKIKTAW